MAEQSKKNKSVPFGDEPRRHPWYMVLLALVALGTVPFPFIGGETRILLGLPLWLWWSMMMTAALSALTAWGILRYWKGEHLD